ncbi:MAG: hypothetical protein EAZ18_22190 [Oscillatoriales cyanobacterium]|nr:MAG: hypothetical protein EAZ18_22190 [Oscillatoriales cyanobacterium]
MLFAVPCPSTPLRNREVEGLFAVPCPSTPLRNRDSTPLRNREVEGLFVGFNAQCPMPNAPCPMSYD